MSTDQGSPTPPSNDQNNPQPKDEEDRGGPIGWLYRRYQDFDTWKGRYEWFNWLMSFFKTHTAATVATTSAAAVAVGGTVALVDPDIRERWLPETWNWAPAVQTVETERWGSSMIFPIEGEDNEGNSAAFDVAVLPTNLTWAHQSTTILSQGGQMIPDTDVPERVFSTELREGLGRSQAVMAVGLASQEGRRETEAERARRRANTAAGWLASIFDEEKPVWVLNLGQFQGGCDAAQDADGTAWQRPLIVVGIREEEEGVNLAEAFADAISDKTNLPSRDCYTNFDLTKYR